jgi:hypothetical protein
MTEDTYENVWGGNAYTISIPKLICEPPFDQTEKIPAIDIGPDILVRKTDNFIILTGNKFYFDTKDPASDTNGTKFLRFYIIPITDAAHKNDQVRAEELLESAAQQHQIPTDFRLVRDHDGDTHACLCIRFDFSEENWQEYIKADLNHVQTEIKPDTVPHIGYLQKLFSEGKNKYIPASI